jgi:hypothetical protein
MLGLRSVYTNTATYVPGDILYDLGIVSTGTYSHAVNDVTTVSYSTTEHSIVGNIKNNFTIAISEAAQIFNHINPDSYISFTSIGSEFNFYGIGLGEYFICIGLFVGTLSQVVVYDKKKRVKKVKAPK